MLARFWHSDKARGDDKPLADRELAKFNHARDILKAHFQGGEHRDGPACLCQPDSAATGSAANPGGGAGNAKGPAAHRNTGAAGASSSDAAASSSTSGASSSSSSTSSSSSSSSASSAHASSDSASASSTASSRGSDQPAPASVSKPGAARASGSIPLTVRQKVVLGILAFSLFGFAVGGVRNALSSKDNQTIPTLPQPDLPPEKALDPSHLIQIPSRDSQAVTEPNTQSQVPSPPLPESDRPDPQLLIEQGRAWSDVDRYQKAVRQNNSNITQLKLKLAQSELTPSMRAMLEQELAGRQEELARDKVSLVEAELRLKQLGGFRGQTVRPEPAE